MRAALIKLADGLVENVILVGDGYTAPDGYTVVASEEAGPGWSWSEAGGFVAPPAPAPDPDAVPQQVSRAQAKIALSRNSLLDATEQQVAAAGGEVAIWYADAAVWKRDNANVISLGAALGLTDAQIDDLFRQAAAIEA